MVPASEVLADAPIAPPVKTNHTLDLHVYFVLPRYKLIASCHICIYLYISNDTYAPLWSMQRQSQCRHAILLSCISAADILCIPFSCLCFTSTAFLTTCSPVTATARMDHCRKFQALTLIDRMAIWTPSGAKSFFMKLIFLLACGSIVYLKTKTLALVEYFVNSSDDKVGNKIPG